jgi:hypothetical protein
VIILFQNDLSKIHDKIPGMVSAKKFDYHCHIKLTLIFHINYHDKRVTDEHKKWCSGLGLRRQNRREWVRIPLRPDVAKLIWI